MYSHNTATLLACGHCQSILSTLEDTDLSYVISKLTLSCCVKFSYVTENFKGNAQEGFL